MVTRPITPMALPLIQPIDTAPLYAFYRNAASRTRNCPQFGGLQNFL